MRTVNDIEISVVRWFAAQTDNPLRQSLLADLDQATAEVIDTEQLTIRFEIDGYTRPTSGREHPVPIDAAVQDSDDASLAVVLATDENKRLFELQVIRFESGPVLGPKWSTLRRLMPGEIVRLNAGSDREARRNENRGVGESRQADEIEKTVYEIDGARIASLEGFFDEVDRVLVPGMDWGKNLDAFNDILRGGFGTPSGGFQIRWKDHRLSRARLGVVETMKYSLVKLRRSRPSNWLRQLRDVLDLVLRRRPTLFEQIVAIIRSHGSDGAESGDKVKLWLE